MKALNGGSSFATLILLSVAVLLVNLHCAGDDGKSFAPDVVLLSCPPDTVLQGYPCVFEWKGSDRDGRVAGYFYGVNEEAPGIWTTAEACTLNSLPAGRHVFVVLAQDDGGKKSPPASCAFTIKSSDCAVAPITLDFGTVAPGSHSELAFTITNSGQSALEGDIVESCGDFEITSGAGAFSISGGESHEATVRFSPVSCGAKTCLIESGSDSCLSVSCVGMGGGDSCKVSPSTIEFGDVDLGAVSDLTFTLTNTGCVTLDGVVSEQSEDYSIVAGGSYSLGPEESQEVTVRFSPGACGPSHCSIDVGHGACAIVSCSGSGVGSACEVYPTVLDFGEVAKGTQQSRAFWIRNSGCTSLQGNISEECSAYTIESDPAWSLAPGESSEVTVEIHPVSCEDDGTCWIDVGHILADSVLCTGTVGCGCWVSDEDMYHDFGCLEGDLASNKSFEIKNLGYDTLRVDIHLDAGGGGAFSISLGGGYQIIPPDQEHQVVVRFCPRDEPSFTCFLDLGECGRIKLAGKRCDGDQPLPTMKVRCGR